MAPNSVRWSLASLVLLLTLLVTPLWAQPLLAQDNGDAYPNDPIPTPVIPSLPAWKVELERQPPTQQLVNPAAAPINDDIAFAVNVTSLPYNASLDTTQATIGLDDPAMGCGYGSNANTVWYKVTMPKFGRLTVSTVGSTYDTVVSVFNGNRGALNMIACDDDTGGSGSSYLDPLLVAGLYWVEVADYGSPGGGTLQVQFSFSEEQMINVPLDIVLLQDETGSMADDISVLADLSPRIYEAIKASTTIEFRIGVVGFRDYAYDPWGSPADWVYRRVVSPTNDRRQFADGVGTLTASGGADTPEGQLAALYYLLTPDAACVDSTIDGDCSDSQDTPSGQQPVFRSGARRIVLLATDAPFHTPTDTDGYPGPSASATLDRLLATRTILIGLTPGGPGYVPQLDELAAATGGSVQSTGASGQDVAKAILNALKLLRPISAEKSTVETNAGSVAADGASEASIVVTLRDTAGAPVPGRRVLLMSSRSSSDLVVQPSAVTDEQGRAYGSIRSFIPGDTAIQAMDANDALTIAQQAIVRFTGETVAPDAELSQVIRGASNLAIYNLDVISRSTGTIASRADYFRSQIGPDEARLAINTLFFLLGANSSFKAAAEPLVRVRMFDLMATDGDSWAFFLQFRQVSVNADKLFDIRLREALLNRGITRAWQLIEGSLPYLAARLGKYEVENVVQDKVREIIADKFADSDTAMVDTAKILQDDIAELKQALAQQSTAAQLAVPPMNDAQRTAAIQDVRKRTGVGTVFATVVQNRAFMLDSLAQARDAGSAWWAFIPRFGAQLLAGAVFGPGAAVAVEAVPAYIDASRHWKNLTTAQREFSLTPGYFKEAAEGAATIFQNTAGGTQRLLQRRPALPPVGVPGGVYMYRTVEDWSSLWAVRDAWATVDIYNSGSETTTYLLVTQFDHTDTFYLTFYGLMKLVEYDSITLEPGQRGRVQIDFKEGERGASPDSANPFTIDVIGYTANGAYLIGSLSSYWAPTTYMAAADGTLVIGAAADDDRPAVEAPVAAYLTPATTVGDYDLMIAVSNPFTGSINATLTQTLPAGATILATNGEATKTGAVWNLEIGAHDIISLTLRFHVDSALGSDIHLAPAHMSFVEPILGLPLQTTANDAVIRTTPPLTADMHVTDAVYGTSGTTLVTATNLLATNLSASFRITVFDLADAVVYTSVQPLSLGNHTSGQLSFELPAHLTPGVYRLTITLEDAGGSELITYADYTVSGSQLFLPVLRR